MEKLTTDTRPQGVVSETVERASTDITQRLRYPMRTAINPVGPPFLHEETTIKDMEEAADLIDQLTRERDYLKQLADHVTHFHIKAEERAEAAERELAQCRARLVNREARRLEILDWLQDQIGTAFECPQCHHSTYHATANECAECGTEFPLANMLAFKLHASGTDNKEYIKRARALLTEPQAGGEGMTEYAWLIEMWDGGAPTYWCRLDDENGVCGWSKDHNKAVRFKRSQDAQAIIDENMWTEPWPVEHGWDAPVCPYCGTTEGLRLTIPSEAPTGPEYTCGACFTPRDDGPCFDDLPQAGQEGRE